MKRLFLLLATVGLFATACQKNEQNGTDGDGGSGGGNPQKIVLAQTKMCVAYADGEYQVTVTSPYSWDARSKNEDWLTVENASGIAGDDELVFSVAANESDKVRKGTIVVKNEDFGLISEFYVVQAANGQSLDDLKDEENKNDNGGNNGGGSGTGGDNNGGDNGGGSGVGGGTGNDDGGNTGGGNTGGDNTGGNTGGGNTPGAGEKKLVKMALEDGGYSGTTTYSYDNQGRLIKAVCEDRYYSEPENGEGWGRSTRTSISSHTTLLSRLLNHHRRRTSSTRSGTRGWETYTYTTQYEWSDSTIKVIEQDGDYTSSSTYTLNNGLVRSCSAVSGYYTSTENYYYDGGRLVRIVNNQDYCTYCTWDGDKLTSVKWDGESDVISLTYNGTCKKSYNPLIGWYAGIYDADLVLANPHICGMRTNQLLATFRDTYKTGDGTEIEEMTFSYELNKDGYISKVTMRDSEGYSTVCALTWE